MGRLKILASGKSPQAQAQARGKLFEDLMTLVLRDYGYQIDEISNVNYAGMEIDIEGKSIITETPLYAECKCYETEVDSPKFQAFFGKYMTRWFKDNKCQGLFVALPGVNSHAKGFYRDNCEGNSQITFRLIEEEAVIAAMYGSQAVKRQETFAASIEQGMGIPGDWLILYTDKGCFWVQYVIPPGTEIATSLALFDGKGNFISSLETVDYLTQLYPELDDFEDIPFNDEQSVVGESSKEDAEQIVEVRGSSACFEYQFPASPEYFVGREAVLGGPGNSDR
ncbi:MAG: restriction endonuclease [Chloroflexi bacterium]|nr:restriction endonuclease [Chloroflexota bacterium]